MCVCVCVRACVCACVRACVCVNLHLPSWTVCKYQIMLLLSTEHLDVLLWTIILLNDMTAQYEHITFNTIQFNI